MIDEVHILSDQYRGPTLEAVVSRMRSIHRFIGTPEEPMRIIALSATIPNVVDLAAWVGEGNTKCYYNIAESRRPIKIEKHVLGFNCDTSTSSYRFDLNLNYKLFDIIRKHSSGRPTLVFCSTRKAVEIASNHLLQFHTLNLPAEQRNTLFAVAGRISNEELKLRLVAGFAYHHAGLNLADRSVLEEAFRAGHIPVLCCTSALAMGVNLPAHLVIIKSTEMYTDYGMEEYPESSIFQMIGRAGRPQFDTFGVAVIMTQRAKVQKYERLAAGSVPIESYLHQHLAEHLNSEIVLQTITDLRTAMDWIRSTFLYVRALASPTRYGLSVAGDHNRSQIEQKLEELCRTELNALEAYSLTVIGKDRGANPDEPLTISSTVYGRLMAQYCLSFRTVKLLRKIKGTEPLLEVFTILTHCDEFTAFKCRNSDKRALNELNRSTAKATIRFPLRGRIQTTTTMVSCLLQAVLGNLPIGQHSLQQEAARMITLGRRLIKCIAEFIYVGRETEEASVYQALLNTLILAQCLETKLWEDSPFITKQLKGIGPVYAGQLAARGKTSFQEILNTDPRELEVILKKNPPFGNEMIDFIRKLPRFSIELSMKEDYMMEFVVTQTNADYDKQLTVRVTLLVGDTANTVLFFKDNCDASFGGNCRYAASFKLTDATVASATGHVICVNWTGLDCSQTVSINGDANVELQKRRSRKANNHSSMLITEFYQKETRTEVNEPPVEVHSSPETRPLDAFRFNRKQKLTLNSETIKPHEEPTISLLNSPEPVEKRPKQDFLTHDAIFHQPTKAFRTQLAMPESPIPHYRGMTRQEYFIDMHRKNPYLLFGHPNQHPLRLSNPEGGVGSGRRRVCIFGVFTEIPDRRQACFETNDRRDRLGRRSCTASAGERRPLRQLDLGIADFLASPPRMQKEDFFK
ncbi:probable ATP-dependent DNA helicase HFM1 [Wyeomyia smithii]|uniref:probable ATP-dependent DNA helicase HFM1 n=1 Tax=Wyeomyia smithii TaxID=174621 RepID=UPI00246813E1|nr:probable ATP-dependent DNA helicase HFM1 [Wyeomyia smithii]